MVVWSKNCIKGSYAISVLIMLTCLIAFICFAATRLYGRTEYADYTQEAICQAAEVVEYVDSVDPDKHKIWCSCNDRERSEAISPCQFSQRPSGSFQIPCLRLNVHVYMDALPTHLTWLKMSDVKHVKGDKCTNSCDDRTIIYEKDEAFNCWYNPNDANAYALRQKQSFSYVFHALFWPMLIFGLAFVLFMVTVICHRKSSRTASQSYI